MSDIRIEIVGDVESREGSYNGRDYTVYSQPAYLHRPSAHYPERISFQIASVNEKLPVGYYEIDFDKSLNVGQWNSLGFNRNLALIPSKPLHQVQPVQQAKQTA